MEPKYSDEQPLMSSRIGSGRLGSGGTKRLSDLPIASSCSSSSDEETTTTDYYSNEASALSPGAESLVSNVSDTSLSLKVDEFTNYRLPGSERSSASAHSQRSSASSASSRYRKKRVTDSGSVAGASDSGRRRLCHNNNDGETKQPIEPCESESLRSRRCSRKQQKDHEESIADDEQVTVSSSIPVLATVTITSSSSLQSLSQCPADERPSSIAALQENASVMRARLSSLEMHSLPKNSPPHRLLRGRHQKLAELKPNDSSNGVFRDGAAANKNLDSAIPQSVRLRPLPKSFFQQPNRPSPIPPGISAFPLLPPLGDEQLNAAELPKAQRCSALYVGNVDLLHRLFDRVEGKERKSKGHLGVQCAPTSYQRGGRSNSLPRAPCAKLDADPFLMENITDRLFPELCLDQESSTVGNKTITLPLLGHSEVNYPQMLSELVTQI